MVQEALERLTFEGELEIAVGTVGYRSSFIGAALSSLPGTSTRRLQGRTVVSLGRGPRPPWREAPEVLDAVRTVSEISEGSDPSAPSRRQTAKERKAIELHAVRRAEKYFRDREWDVENVGPVASYDLRCTKRGHRLRVEVKGTTSAGRKVLLTRNEVRHAHGTDDEIALFILAGVTVSEEDGRVRARGGVHRVLHPWTLDDLLPTCWLRVHAPMIDGLLPFERRVRSGLQGLSAQQRRALLNHLTAVDEGLGCSDR